MSKHFASSVSVEQLANELMDTVASAPGESGNVGRLYAAKANLECAALEPIVIPERWYKLMHEELRLMWT